MSNVNTFIELLKADKIIEAFQIVKDELSARARVVAEEVNLKVAEGFNMKAIVEKQDDDETEDENLSDEEKEAKKAKEAEEAAKGE